MTLQGFALGCALSSCIAPAPSAKNSTTPGNPAPGTPGPARAFVWPHGARAAVSLTYDDAIQSQIDNAVSALARHALPATFFLTGSSPYLQGHLDAHSS